MGNIHYVGGANIASYLITTPQGHILIDTGMNEMHDVIKNNVAKLGFKASDIKIMLSSHAHFDHIDGHALMQRLTGAQVMAMTGDAEALESGKDNSALGAIGWEPVKVGPRAQARRYRVAWRDDAARAAHARAHAGCDDLDDDRRRQGPPVHRGVSRRDDAERRRAALQQSPS